MWHSLSIKEVESKLQTDLQQGLSDDEITVRLKKYGENKLQEPKKESVFVKFLKQFNDFMIIILIIAAIISAVVAKMQGIYRFNYNNNNSGFKCYYGRCTRSKSRKIIGSTKKNVSTCGKSEKKWENNYCS